MTNKISVIKKTSKWKLAAVFGLFGAFAAFNMPAAEYAHAQEKIQDGQSVKDVESLHKEGALKDIARGNKDAPMTIIEYSSLTCGHCANFHKKVLPDLKSKYIDTGKARYIVREFPLDNLSVAAFMLARCKEDKYSDIVENLYAHQEEWAFAKNPLEKLKERAKTLGYTDESFMSCLRDQALLDKIVSVRDLASKEFGVTSTPTLFVDGKIIRGPSHISQIEEAMGDKK
jgi:protein-disulfide isomerase